LTFMFSDSLSPAKSGIVPHVLSACFRPMLGMRNRCKRPPGSKLGLRTGDRLWKTGDLSFMIIDPFSAHETMVIILSSVLLHKPLGAIP
jgi:hypothetical protein